MTEQEAINVLKRLVLCGTCTTGPCEQCERDLAKKAALAALEEIQTYRAIGTVEECREAVEKQRKMKPIEVSACRSVSYYRCPVCREILAIDKGFCCKCGQPLEWGT